MFGQSAATIIVPCYNEKNRFKEADFLDFLKRHSDFKFLMVDDGSTDGTGEMLGMLARKQSGRIDVLKLEKNMGKAEAVRRGLLHAAGLKSKLTGFWDADLATPLETLPLFADIFEKRPEIEMVFGARVKLMGSDIKRSELRHYLGRIFATCASGVLGLSIYDTQCGAKMFRVTEDLLEALNSPFTSRWIFDVELIARLRNLKRKMGSDISKTIYELPLPVWHDVKGSKLKPSDFFRAFGELIQIALHC